MATDDKTRRTGDSRDVPDTPYANGLVDPNVFAGVDPKQALTAVKELLAQSAKHPGLLARHQFAFAQELVKALTGTSEFEPLKGDRRFADPSFAKNPFFLAWMQSYLAWQRELDAWVDDVGLDNKNTERARFFVSLITDALAPTNFLLGNPSALRKTFETKGMSVVQGVRHMAEDIVGNAGLPAQVDKSAFTVGENLATTPGAVVFRNPVLELIQYAPTTKQVRERPLIMVPPQINKFYVYDISPGKSLIDYAVRSGFQVFAVSWFNPTPEQRDWSLETYLKALEEGIDAARDITGSEDVNILGACSGGMTVATLLGSFSARGIEKVNSLSLLVSVLDTAETDDTLLGLFTTKETVQAAKLASQSKGVLEGRDLARIFAWLRPNDLVWNYWVSNYLHGNEPPAFDILYWNNDTTRLPAGLHGEFMDIALDNALATPGKLVIGGTPIDLRNVKCDVFATGGLTDHITPWKACYASCKLMGGHVDFVLSSSGHIQSIINPPGNPKARFYTNANAADTADAFVEGATEHKESWWDYWRNWLEERSGGLKPAPKALGNRKHPAGEKAPGTYVLSR